MLDAEARGLLPRGGGGEVFEGTSGSTGISLAALCRPLKVPVTVVVPDDQSPAKFRQIEAVGGEVRVTRTAGISSPEHYVNVARRLARERQAVLDARGLGGVALFADQFDNPANRAAHFRATGPEIARQMEGRGLALHAFVMSAGTGGTIAGAGSFLKTLPDPPRVVLADPPGSVFHNRVERGVAYAEQQREQTIRRHR